jgi:hypothetical protein
MPAGRPSEYEVSYPVQVRRLVETGATWRQIADYFGVAVSTVQSWAHRHPEFSAAIKATKDEADLAVENALFQRATGYTVDSIKIFVNAKGEETQVPFQEHVPPDTTAMIFWLKNRKSTDWKDRSAHSLENPDGTPIQFVTKSILEP